MSNVFTNQGKIFRKFQSDFWGRFLSLKKFNNLRFYLFSFFFKSYLIRKMFNKFKNRKQLNFFFEVLIYPLELKSLYSFKFNNLNNIELLRSELFQILGKPKIFILSIISKYKANLSSINNLNKVLYSNKKPDTKYKKLLLNKQKFQIFYGNFTTNKLKIFFKKFNKVNKNKIRLVNFLMSFEFKLDVLLYRSNFVSDIKEAHFLIKNSFILVNYKPITFLDYVVDFKDIITIAPSIRKAFILKLLLRFNSGRLISGIPSYILVDFKRLVIIPLQIKSSNEVKYLTSIKPNHVLFLGS